MKRVVVSGATSFLGSAVVEKLIALGCEVYGIVRPSSSARAWLPNDPKFHEVLCDFGNTEKWAREVGCADTLLHFAWGGPGIQGRSDPVVQKQSADNTFKALYVAGELGITRFFTAGSQAEYGRTRGRITEATPCKPFLEYGKNKLRVCREAPEIAEKLGMEYVHSRFFSVYGPHDHPYTLIPSCIRTFLAGEKMVLSECGNLWNFLYVSDAAEAVARLAECELPSPNVIVNVAGTETRVLREYVDEIYRLCGERGSCAFGARHVSEPPVDNWPDISRLLSLIDWKPRVSFVDGIQVLIREETERMEQRTQ